MKFARLLFPSAANETILADILDFILDKKMPENEEDPICDLLPKLINQNVSALRKDKDRSHPVSFLHKLYKIRVSVTYIGISRRSSVPFK